MIPIDEALAFCHKAVRALPPETVSLIEAHGRVLAAPVVSALDLPPFTQSAMDGYALRACDIDNATHRQPVILPLAGEVAAAIHSCEPRLPAGRAMRIFTGGTVPAGADTIVRQEDVVPDGDRVCFTAPAPVGGNIRGRGEELIAGTPLLSSGQRLTASRIAALAAAGVTAVRVVRSPRVRLLITGDEVVAAGGELSLGAVPDANGPLLDGWLRERGIVDVQRCYVKDDAATLEASLAQALDEADIVVSAGGVSVGEHDLIIPVARRLGVVQLFWRVRQKPGKPLFLGRSPAGVPLLGLPGNPGAVLVGAAVFLRYLLDGLEGSTEPGPHVYTGIAATPLPGDLARTCWVRCVRSVDDSGRVHLSASDHQASHMLSNLCEADTLARLEPGVKHLEAGQPVPWLAISG